MPTSDGLTLLEVCRRKCYVEDTTDDDEYLEELIQNGIAYLNDLITPELYLIREVEDDMTEREKINARNFRSLVSNFVKYEYNDMDIQQFGYAYHNHIIRWQRALTRVEEELG